MVGAAGLINFRIPHVYVFPCRQETVVPPGEHFEKMFAWDPYCKNQPLRDPYNMAITP